MDSGPAPRGASRNDGEEATHGWNQHFRSREMPGTRLSCTDRAERRLPLTSGVSPLCLRNLEEVRAAICVIKLPNCLSSSYPGAPPGMAKAIPNSGGVHGASWALFYFPKLN